MTNTLLSGGASGADHIFSTCAETLGHKIYAFSFPGHKINGTGAYKLTESQLDENIELVNAACKNIKRSFSKKKPPQPYYQFTRNLFLRNAYQILGIEDTGPSKTVYAVTRLTNDKKQAIGGTGVAISIATSLSHDPTIYIFDMVTSRWYTFVGDAFEPCNDPPSPSGVYSGIGARDLTDAGIDAIGKLYGLE